MQPPTCSRLMVASSDDVGGVDDAAAACAPIEESVRAVALCKLMLAFAASLDEGA